MSYSRNFCALELNNTRDTLGHAYSNRQAIIQQKLLADPVNGLYYVDNEQPSEDTIFKINYPVGSIFTSQRPLVEYQGATRLTQNRPDNITYSFHGCVFRYIHSQFHASDQHTLLTTGRVLLNQENQLYYEAPEAGGQYQSQFTLSGDDLVQPTKLKPANMPFQRDLINSTLHQMPTSTTGSYEYIYTLRSTAGDHQYQTVGTGYPDPEAHTHDFTAIGTLQVNPPRLPIFMYERIQ